MRTHLPDTSFPSRGQRLARAVGDVRVAARGRRGSTAARDGERGQIIVLFTFFLVVILAFAAVAIDLGVLRNANQNLWNSLDAGSLAGVSQLPGDGNAAKAMAMQFANKDYPGGIPSGAVQTSFRCVIGDRNNDGQPDLTDIPLTCDPGPTPLSSWRCANGICAAPCDPSAGDQCNTLVLTGSVTVGYGFARAVGVDSGNTQTVISAACKGPCGSLPVVPVDVVLIVDRTTSMNGVDTDNARSAADSVRTLYNPATQWLSFAMLGPSATGQSCATAPSSTLGSANAPADLRRWVPIGLMGQGASFGSNYAASGSAMAKAINCFTNSSTRTDLTDPIPMAVYELTHNGRPGVRKGIILMSDGQPNTSTTSTSNYCAQANAAATAAKNAGVEIYTVGFGLDGSNDIKCPDSSGTFQNKTATQLLASMANSSFADHGCPGTENDDGDHFFCVPKTSGASADLSNAFKTAASQLAQGTKLIQLP
jgi:Putative Flp pilus-assembly TadE/G-like/von Willebrand factor type A domain